MSHGVPEKLKDIMRIEFAPTEPYAKFPSSDSLMISLRRAGHAQNDETMSKFTTIFLSLVWLGTVCGAVILATARRGEQGAFFYIIIGIATVMFIVFALNQLPRQLQIQPFAEFVGKLSVGLLILLAILTLAVALTIGYEKLGVFGGGVLILFLITFIRIFIDYVKDFNK